MILRVTGGTKYQREVAEKVVYWATKKLGIHRMRTLYVQAVLTKIKNAVAGITISKAAAIKLPIIPTAELFATSAEKSAASNKFEI